MNEIILKLNKTNVHFAQTFRSIQYVRTISYFSVNCFIIVRLYTHLVCETTLSY